MLEVRLNQGKSIAAQPEAFGERRYRMNRWLPLVPMAGMIATLIAILVYPPLDRTSFILTTLMVFLACVFLISYIQKKQKRRADVSSFFPMTTWLAFVPICIAAVVYVNGALDNSAVAAHAVVVTRKIVSSGRSTSYYLETSSWRPDHAYEKLQVPFRIYAQFKIDDRAIVEVHRGALGIAWLGNIHKP